MKQRLKQLLLSEYVTPDKPIYFFSIDGIKLIFDVIRNYSLCALIGLGGAALSHVHRPADFGWMLGYIEYALYGMSLALAGLNVFFTSEIFECTQFYANRKHKLLWQIIGILVNAFIGGVLLFAAVLQKMPT